MKRRDSFLPTDSHKHTNDLPGRLRRDISDSQGNYNSEKIYLSKFRERAIGSDLINRFCASWHTRELE